MSPRSGKSYLRVENLSKSYGALTVTDQISFHIDEGEALALLGPSGCGKTTILRCIAGLEIPNTGIIEIGGRTMYDSERQISVATEHRDLGVVFQSYAVWPHLTVAENVGFPLKVRKLPAAEIDERVDTILDLVGLTRWKHQSATLLSGGQQQRVALARALIHQPAVVLFDEPMSNLDARLRDQMRIELKLLQQRLNFTSIYVTHDQSEAFSLANKVVIMNKGRVETQGSPRTVFSRPATPFVADFFGYNVLPGKVVSVDAGSAEEGVGPMVKVELSPRLQVFGIATAESLRAGDAVLVCIRKEQVQVSAAETMTADAPDSFSGTILTSSYQGLYEEHLVSVDGLKLKAVLPPSCEMNDVVVKLNRDQCFVLPAGGD